MRKRTFIFSALTAMAFAVGVPSLGHAAYPEKPVRVIVPFAPGGGNDFVARVIMDFLSKELGQNFVVENMPGANAALGLQAVSRAAPDGYTLIVSADSTLVINPILRDDLPYDPIESFRPVAGLSRAHLILVGRPDIEGDDKVTNLQELIETAKNNPGKIRFGSGGIGNMTHLAVEQFLAHTDIEMTHIPYPGIGPATTGMMAGDVQFGAYSIQAVAGQIQAGDLIGFGVGEKLDILPDVPTYEEAGVSGYEAYTWIPLLAPAGTPDEVIDRLNEGLQNVLQDPEAIERLRKGGWTPWYQTSEYVSDLIVADTEKWRKIITEANITIQTQ